MNLLLRLFGIRGEGEVARERAYLELVLRLGRAHAHVLHIPVRDDARTETLVAKIDLELCRAFDALKDLEKVL